MKRPPMKTFQPDGWNAALHPIATLICEYPRQDSNLCFRLRRPTLYPLSYGGVSPSMYTTTQASQAN